MENIPEEIRSFIERFVDCIDQLEAIRILANDPARIWDAAHLADVVQSEPEAMNDHLIVLERRGLVSRAGSGWRFQPTSPDLEEMAHAFLKSYLQRPVSVIRLVYAPRSMSIVRP